MLSWILIESGEMNVLLYQMELQSTEVELK